MMRFIRKVGTLFLPIILWWLVVVIFSPDAYLFPSPLSVAMTFFANGGLFLQHGLITLIEVLLGFVLANLIAVSTALILVFVPFLEKITMNIAVAIKTIPIVALAPLLVLWFGSGIWSKVIIVVLVCFFPALVNVIRGVRSLDEDHYELFRIYSSTRMQVIRFFILPGVLPYLLAALKVSSTLAVIGALVGEFISANRGLGFLIITNYYSLNTPVVFACLIITSLVGLGLYQVVTSLERRSTQNLNVTS